MTRETDRILLAHGSGGTWTHRLITEEFVPRFANDTLKALEDQAAFSIGNERLAVTTDSYVVSPLFFPGGDIGELAVNGTINDLAVGGYEPLLMTLAFIIEEGLPMADLRRILDSVARAAREAGVPIVAGDTKVVHKGKADGLFINTTGIGRIPPGAVRSLSAAGLRVGDRVLLSGTVGDHGMAVLTTREGLRFESDIRSDTAPLHGLARLILEDEADIRAMRDPTRGGLATTLVEMARASKVTVTIRETEIPVTEPVRGACELLGLDPLYVANEGKLIAFIDPRAADRVLERVRLHPYGSQARLIGEVTGASKGEVVLATAVGSRRVVGMLSGEQLPRIC
jgi:hydrogenase expression/formation protein HypE